jgi:DNA (cytosine-5)-methyltransferase 1
MEKNFPWMKYSKMKKDDIFSATWPKTEDFIENSQRKIPEGTLANLTVQYWFEKNGVDNHPNACDFFKPRAGLVRFKSVPEGDDSKKCFKRLHRWRYSPTAAYGNNEVHLHPYKARRLTVAETLAIQSLPHEFEMPPGMTLSNKFKAVGNGVPFLAAKSIATSLDDFITSIL